MQFPGMMPMQFAQSPDLATQLQGLAKAGQPLAKMAGQAYRAPGAPMDISPAATNAPQPGLMDALKGMSPQAILDQLRAMSAGGQQPQGLPGSAALQGAGMLSQPMAPDGGAPMQSLLPGG